MYQPAGPEPLHLAYRTVIVIACMAMVYTSGCSFSTTSVEDIPGTEDVSDTEEPIYLTDLTGAKWDISHAIRNYDFNLKGFSPSKGPYARPPIIDPQMISPNEPGYPPKGATARVIATYVGSEGRAYPIDLIVRNEVVDDRVAGTPVTVAY